MNESRKLKLSELVLELDMVKTALNNEYNAEVEEQLHYPEHPNDAKRRKIRLETIEQMNQVLLYLDYSISFLLEISEAK